MTLTEAVIEKVKALPVNRQQEVLDFAEFLETKESAKPMRRKNLQGSLAHLNFDFTEEDLREARNEMWRGYTKDTEDELVFP
ncbi:MAG: DUF2281 domain-containing protein [Acidobacteria bacterium]|nr:DUF2281 domain-containing protein [Acidobacteriota bacterium]